MHVIDRPVVNYRIQDLIEGVLKDGLDSERAVEMIAAGRLPARRDDGPEARHRHVRS